eukprot:14687533-Alexandrium_andersonii.AAC.1
MGISGTLGRAPSPAMKARSTGIAWAWSAQSSNSRASRTCRRRMHTSPPGRRLLMGSAAWLAQRRRPFTLGSQLRPAAARAALIAASYGLVPRH